jgi:hypothetical protein
MSIVKKIASLLIAGALVVSGASAASANEGKSKKAREAVAEFRE